MNKYEKFVIDAINKSDIKTACFCVAIFGYFDKDEKFIEMPYEFEFGKFFKAVKSSKLFNAVNNNNMHLFITLK